MLTPAVLSIDLLKQIDNHFRPTIYKHYRTPLLGYTPEAVVIFAITIYNYILRPSGLAPNTTQEDYLDYITKTYREAMDVINPTLEDFIRELETIVAEPQYKDAELQPHSISEYIKYFKTGVDTENGYNAKYYPALHDFFYSVTSPLRTQPYVSDRRINDIKYEVDALQRRHSERLVIFIRQELYTLSDQLRDLKEMPTDTNPKNDAQPLTGYGLPPDVEVILEQFLAEANAKAQVEAEVRLKQVESNAKAEARIKEIEAQSQARQAQQEPKNLTPEEYLNSFIRTLEPHYNTLASKYEGLHIENPKIARLDDMHAFLHATKYAKSYNLDLNTVLALQTQAQSEILHFDNIKPVLLACLQCYVYNLAIEDILTPEILDHGVVKGILEATARSAPDIARRGYRPNGNLAEALYNKILSNTDGFATALPLPEIEPQTSENMRAKAKELTHKESVPKGDILPFDLTRHLAQVMHEMKADTITTYTKVLSVSPDPSILTPVNNHTLKDVACLLIGRASTPYLLNGDIVIHDEADNKYYRIIPNIDKDGYASYGFRIYRHQNLSSRIYRQQNLLKTSTEYKYRYCDDPYYDPFTNPSKKVITDEDFGHRKYEPLPNGNPEIRQNALADLEAWDKVLTDRINDIFDDPEYDQAHAKAQAEYREYVSSLQYFYPNVVFTSAHKLAAYVYFPQEYSDLIIRKPLDPETGEPLIYHPHHKDGNRSNNSPENLAIISDKLNYELRSTSKPVIYQSKHYNTLKAYCEATEAGAYTKLIERLAALTPSMVVVDFNGRLYTLDPETGVIVATDAPQTPVIDFNGTTYTTLKEFADAHKINYSSLRNALSKARKDNKDSFKYKHFNFYLEDSDNMKITK